METRKNKLHPKQSNYLNNKLKDYRKLSESGLTNIPPVSNTFRMETISQKSIVALLALATISSVIPSAEAAETVRVSRRVNSRFFTNTSNNNGTIANTTTNITSVNITNTQKPMPLITQTQNLLNQSFVKPTVDLPPGMALGLSQCTQAYNNEVDISCNKGFLAAVKGDETVILSDSSIQAYAAGSTLLDCNLSIEGEIFDTQKHPWPVPVPVTVDAGTFSLDLSSPSAVKIVNPHFNDVSGLMRLTFDDEGHQKIENITGTVSVLDNDNFISFKDSTCSFFSISNNQPKPQEESEHAVAPRKQAFHK
jgi:hypothetical protein